MTVPKNPKIYHIMHVDRLESVIASDGLRNDDDVERHSLPGTGIGMSNIKMRRKSLALGSYPELCVGQCVPFYFCPRSIMLYVIKQANNPGLEYRGGQGPIIHLEADLRASVAWAEGGGHRWAFTTSNAGSRYFEDYCDLSKLDEIDWGAVQATSWSACRGKKQAEFLMEGFSPWHLVERIGTYTQTIREKASNALLAGHHRPQVQIMPEWYY